MRGKASVPVRIGRMETQRGNRDLDETIAIVAEELGLDPGDVRHELAEISKRTHQYGPEPLDAQLHRLAAELDIDPEELRAEAAQLHARLAARGVVL